MIQPPVKESTQSSELIKNYGEKCLKSSITDRYITKLSVRVRITVRVIGVSGWPFSDLTSAKNFEVIHLAQPVVFDAILLWGANAAKIVVNVWENLKVRCPVS